MRLIGRSTDLRGGQICRTARQKNDVDMALIELIETHKTHLLRGDERGVRVKSMPFTERSAMDNV